MILARLAVVALAALIAFPPVSDFAAPGPFDPVNHGEGPNCTILRPRTLGEGGLKHPVILWGNGTGTQPANYAGLLSHWASHGFVVAAANTPNAGTGREMLACLDWLAAQDARPGNPYSGHLDLTHIAAAGHSQGGRGALMAGRDPRVIATVPFMPAGQTTEAAADQHGPMLLLSGDADATAPPERAQRPIFEAANIPVFWASLAGAGHLAPGGDGGPYRAVSTAWLRWRLMGDAEAGKMFEGEACGLCGAEGWTVKRKD